MRNLILSAVLIASFGAGSAAFAATTPAHPAPVKAAHIVAPVVSPIPAKQEACAKAWRDQKTHQGTRGAFMKACVAKG